MKSRIPVLLACTTAVVLAHVLLISGWLRGAVGRPPEPASTARLMQIRTVQPETPVPMPPVLPKTEPPARLSAATTATPPRPPRVAPSPQHSSESIVPPAPQEVEASTPVPATAPSDPPLHTTDRPPDAVDAVVEATPAKSTESPALPGVDADVPVYRVSLPPAFTTQYVFKRGMFTGTAELSWAPSGGRYQLSLNAKIMGQEALTQTSQGRFDALGLAPERFIDKPRGRDARAVNFQQEQGVITFSGPSATYAWRKGVQDRLSWLVQLPAIVAGQGRDLNPGDRFAFVVVGSRGEADVWTFRLIGWDHLETSSGTVRCVKLVREARHPHDQLIEVWLDSSAHYSTVLARLTNTTDGHVTELLRQ